MTANFRGFATWAGLSLAASAVVANEGVRQPHLRAASILTTVTSEGVLLADVTVTLQSPSGSWILSTDEAGQALFEELPSEAFAISFQHEGYLTIEYPGLQLQTSRNPTTLEVEMSRRLPDGPTRLIPACDYEGSNAKFAADACARSSQTAYERFHELLGRADEPDLKRYSRDEAFEAYRLMWRPTFHKPVVVRLSRLPGAAPAIATKVLSGKGGFEMGELAVSRERLATPAELRAVRSLVSDLGFWDIATDVLKIGDGDSLWICLDGASWAVEGIRGDRLHYISRSCPESDEPVRRLGEFLLRLSGEEFEVIY